MVVKNSSSRFGKCIEHHVLSLMLKDGFDVFLPVMDNNGIDAVIKKPNGNFAEVQIKARSKVAKYPAFYPDIKHEKPRPNFWFVFYAERFDAIFLMSSKEFCAVSGGNDKAKGPTGRQVRFDGVVGGRPIIQERFRKYVVTNFERIRDEEC